MLVGCDHTRTVIALDFSLPKHENRLRKLDESRRRDHQRLADFPSHAIDLAKTRLQRISNLLASLRRS